MEEIKRTGAAVGNVGHRTRLAWVQKKDFVAQLKFALRGKGTNPLISLFLLLKRLENKGFFRP